MEAYVTGVSYILLTLVLFLYDILEVKTLWQRLFTVQPHHTISVTTIIINMTLWANVLGSNPYREAGLYSYLSSAYS
jgi:hypothetical protein